MSDTAALVKQLQDSQLEVRAGAAEQLCQLGEAAQEASLALVKATGDEDSVSQWAVAALEELGPPTADAVDQLSELSGSSVEPVAYWAVTLLGRLEAGAASAEDALVAALSSSPHQAVQERSAWALGKIGARSSAAIDTLKEASHAPSPRLARLAAQALAGLT